ncbi:MAG: helix-turn-helix transcriptional regulator [Pseudomonadota bacterium]
MIRVLLKQQLDDFCFKQKRRVTLNEVAEKTEISRATLTRIANNPGYNCNTDAINALCRYFSCTPCELLTYIPDEESEE